MGAYNNHDDPRSIIMPQTILDELRDNDSIIMPRAVLDELCGNDDDSLLMDILREDLSTYIASKGVGTGLDALKVFASEMAELKQSASHRRLRKRADQVYDLLSAAHYEASNIYQDDDLTKVFEELCEFFGRLYWSNGDRNLSRRERFLSTGRGLKFSDFCLTDRTHKIYLIVFLHLLDAIPNADDARAFWEIDEDYKLPPYDPLVAIPQIQSIAPNIAA
jgi:hypothetical protein